MSALEIAYIPASEAYLADRSSFKPALDAFLKVPGVVANWTGLQKEEPNTLFLITVWESYEKAEAAHSTPEFQKFIELSQTVAAGPPTIQFINPVSPADEPLNAPVTEFAFCQIKQGSKEAFVALAGKLKEGLAAIPTVKGATAGEVRGHEADQAVLIVGWDSYEDHIKVATGVNAEGVAALQALADLTVKHVYLKKSE